MTEQIKPKIKKSWIGEILELGVFLIQLTIIITLLNVFVFQLFLIPSGSMRPTLLVGDYVFVTKYNYGYSPASLTFSIPFSMENRIFGKSPERGDIAVFKHKNAYTGEVQDYIKRVIGLPNDKLEMRDGVLFINDKAVERKKIGILKNSDYTEVNSPVDVYQETLPNGKTYHTLKLSYNNPGDSFPAIKIPENMYFMMGDNRDNSEDSRFSLGYIPFSEFVGKAQFLFFSIKNETKPYMIWRWPQDVRWSRIFSSVKKMMPLPSIGFQKN